MPEGLRVLLDQNVPRSIKEWLSGLRPKWIIEHATEVGLQGKADDVVFRHATEHRALIITFDEDFADRRLFSSKPHFGIVRLRIWPTTAEETQTALRRLLDSITDEELSGSLVIIDRSRIRIRTI